MDSLEHKQKAFEALQKLQPALRVAEGMRMAGFDQEEDAAVLHKARQLEAAILEMETRSRVSE